MIMGQLRTNTSPYLLQLDIFPLFTLRYTFLYLISFLSFKKKKIHKSTILAHNYLSSTKMWSSTSK